MDLALKIAKLAAFSCLAFFLVTLSKVTEIESYTNIIGTELTALVNSIPAAPSAA
jgi:hypothetical protein